MSSPFVSHRPTVPAGFWGRDTLVEEILELVGSGQSCAIVGDRGLGKSSLLGYLADPETLLQHDLDPDGCLPLPLDFIQLHDIEPKDLWAEILSNLGHKVDSPTFADVRRVLQEMEGRRIVFLCDEMQLAVENPRLDGAVFGALRSLVANGCVFVIASRMSLLELEQYRDEETRQKVLTSPFFNLFIELRLPLLERREIGEMIAGILDETEIRFVADDVRFIERVAGYHPYLIQLTATALYDAYTGRITLGDIRRENLSDDDRESLVARVARDAEKLFRNQWRHCTDAERAALLALADGGPYPADDMIERLLHRGLLVEFDGEACIASRLFGDWLPRQADQADAPATIGRYEIIEELGYGERVRIYRAWDGRLRSMVILKVLRREIRANEANREAWLEKANRFASLDHPLITVIHEVNDTDVFLVEELVAGYSLRDSLEIIQDYGTGELLQLAEEIAAALAVLHDREIVHGSLRLETVLLGRIPQPGQALPPVKISGFGGLRHETWKQGPEVSSMILLISKAPELLAGGTPNPATDIYAAGAVLYECRHGVRPPLGGLGQSTAAHPFDALIERCLARDTGYRFANGRELLEALRPLTHSP